MARSDYTHKTVTDCATGNTERVALSEAEIDEFVAMETAWTNAGPTRAWAAIRSERNARLAQTDFYSLSDVTMSDAMTAHRKALRDLPANTDDPEVFVESWNTFQRGDDGASDPWPTKPE